MKKKFYILLCMLLGVALLLIIQHSLLALYIILSDNNSKFAVLDVLQLQIITVTSTLIAIVIGLFYGNYLGHHWWPLVYGDENDVRTPERFNESVEVTETEKSVTIKPVRANGARVRLSSQTRSETWDFEDLMNYDAPAVESLSGAAAPSVVSAVTLTEETPKKKVVRKKTAVKKSPAKTSSAAKTTTVKKKTVRKPKAPQQEV